ncbi:MAG: DNA repair protein RecO [Christensenellales bacterium]
MNTENKITALCCKSIDYKENDKLVTLVSAEKGKIVATCKSVKKINAKLKFASMPFNFGEYTLVGKDGKYIITDCKQIESFSEISLDIKRYYAGFAVLKSMLDFSLENTPCPKLLSVGVRALKALAIDKIYPTRVYNKFVLYALDCLGYNLNFNCCSVCGQLLDKGYFSKDDGIVCADCGSVFKSKIPHEVFENLISGGVSEDERVQRNTNIFINDVVYDMLGVKIAILE